jgi:DNA-binding beta-propeller fold protein YncE
MEEETFMFPRSATTVFKNSLRMANGWHHGAHEDLPTDEFGSAMVQVFDSDGNYLDQIGDGGTGDGEFTTPIGVKVDRDSNIWVVDRGNHRVQKFT